MSSLSTRLNLILPDDGGAGGDDDIDVTTQISNNFQNLENAIPFLHVANQAALPVSGNFKGRLAWADDTDTVYRYDGAGWIVWEDMKWQTWATPGVPVTQNGNVVPGTSTITAKYKRKAKDVKFWYRFELGTSGFSGGSGDWAFPPPFPLVGDPSIDGSGWVYLHGYSYYDAQPKIGAGPNVTLYCPANNISGNYWPFKNESWNGTVGGGAGTGTPTRSGGFTFDQALPDSELFFVINYQYIA